MDSAQQQLAEKLKAANYVLVTVSHDPSVDQLASLIGLTLLLNKAGKHAAAVFSGEVPSTLEFLQPEDTIEKNTDSLRDFIIALDKSKADKLRYKVEDDVVRIFITPYKTSISQSDLEFSQGDFNVDVVVALGVTRQEDLDEAIIAHGRILHDAMVATVNLTGEGDLGSLHWQDPEASSLSEMMTELARLLGGDLVDNQIATALLTGVVAETDRFSNEKTTAQTMSASAVLMSAGANQQLVASQLAQSASNETAEPKPATDDSDQTSEDAAADKPVNEASAESEPEEAKGQDGALEIDHKHDAHVDNEESDSADEPHSEQSEEPDSEHTADEAGFVLPGTTEPDAPEPNDEPESEHDDQSEPKPESAPEEQQPQAGPSDHVTGGSRLITEPPTLGGQLTANSQPEALEPSSDPLGRTEGDPDTLLSHTSSSNTLPASAPTDLTPPPPTWKPAALEPVNPEPSDVPPTPEPDKSLADIESASSLDDARDEVTRALNSSDDQPLAPVEALNAQPMVDNLHAIDTPSAPITAEPPLIDPAPAIPGPTIEQVLQNNIPSLPLPPSATTVDPLAPVVTATAFDPTAFGITSAPGAPVPGVPSAPTNAPAPQVFDPTAPPPPVPPPIPFDFGGAPKQ